MTESNSSLKNESLKMITITSYSLWTGPKFKFPRWRRNSGSYSRVRKKK
jgi:hypothetical protein